MISDPDYSVARQPRQRRRFTVLLPVLRPPDMLPYAIRSVLAQTEPDFELCVICDGAPADTAAAAQAFARTDPRVLVFAFPKGQRLGEAHRAAVLEGARSDFVAQIGDDDLWLPDHLARLAVLLTKADFVSVPSFNIGPDGQLQAGAFGDLGQAHTRQKMLTSRWNFFGPTESAYRLTSYRQLPDGWSPGPEGLWSDLNMWRKFLCFPGLRFRSDLVPSTLKMPTPYWQNQPLSERARASEMIWKRLQEPGFIPALRSEAAVLLARSIKPRHLPRLIATDPKQYLPVLRRRLFPDKPALQPLF
jgi:hypothetical protein